MDISDLRKEIDHIDKQILELLNKRADAAQKIGRQKKSEKKPFFIPEREAQVLSKLTSANEGPLPDESVRTIYREIISACRAMEEHLNIAYWGPPATNTHMASIRKFGSACTFVPMDTIPDVFREVEKEKSNYGVIPIENSTEGVINHTLDTFLESRLKICSEIYLPITHYLLSKASKLSEIKKVYSIPTAAAQCRNWLHVNLPDVEIVDVSTTAKGAQLCSEEKTAAAIGTILAADIYGLKVLAEHIEDNPQNRTRFLVVGMHEPAPSGKDKTSIMFSVQHKAGSLYRAMSVFEKYNINLTMIESRPTKLTPWEYVFFIDCQGHIKDKNIAEAVQSLKDTALFVNVLGSYPEAD